MSNFDVLNDFTINISISRKVSVYIYEIKNTEIELMQKKKRRRKTQLFHSAKENNTIQFKLNTECGRIKKKQNFNFQIKKCESAFNGVFISFWLNGAQCYKGNGKLSIKLPLKTCSGRKIMKSKLN